jgi:protein SCO1/2
VAAVLVILAAAVAGVLAVRVARAWASGLAGAPGTVSVVQRVNRDLPPLRLTDQDGRALEVGDLRGRTTLVTFLFGHCTSVCPLTVQDLEAARRASGRHDVQIIVITLDPWRDTPERLPSLAVHWGLSSGDRVFSGAVADVEEALDSLGVARSRDPMTGNVDHITSVLMLDPEGKIAWRVEGNARGVAGMLARSP